MKFSPDCLPQNRKLFYFWAMALLLKLLLSAVLPLSSDESYYWVWSQNLRLSYFDHPPFVSWLFRMGDFFPFSRWPGVLLGHFTVFIWVFLLGRDFSLTKQLGLFLLMIFSPLVGFGSLIVTPDIPILFFWSLGIYSLSKYFQKNSSAWLWTSLLGLSIGFGIASKYHMFLFVILMTIYLSAEKKWRQINPVHLLSVFILAVLGSLPVWIWNFQNHFASFLFQIHHGLGESSWDPFWTWTYLLGQFALVSPIVFYFAIKAKIPNHLRPIIYFGWGPFLFFFLTSFRGLVELNWATIGYPSLFVLALLGSEKIKPFVLKGAFWSFIFICVFTHQFYPWLNNSPLRWPDKINELRMYDPVIAALHEHPKLKTQRVFASSYQMASVIWYQTQQKTDKMPQMSRRDFFDDLNAEFPTENTFYLIGQEGVTLPDWFNPLVHDISVYTPINERFKILKIVKK